MYHMKTAISISCVQSSIRWKYNNFHNRNKAWNDWSWFDFPSRVVGKPKMKYCISNSLLSLIVLFFFILCFHDYHRKPLSSKPATELFAALDGTMYLVDTDSGRFIWSFSTGSPIYHSYQSPINNPNPNHKNNASGFISGLIECGDDWELIVHDNHFGKMRLSKSIGEYVALTPSLSKDGAVILGSQTFTIFTVDAKTGAPDLVNASAVWSANEFADPGKLNSPQFLLKIIRTDYFLQSVDRGSRVVLWNMTVAEFKAVLVCQLDENPSGGGPLDPDDEFDSDSDLDFAMPYECEDIELKDVYRQRKNSVRSCYP